MLPAVGICSDGKLNALLPGEINIDGIQIQPVGKLIDLQACVCTGSHAADFFKIDIVRFPFAQAHAGRMGNDVDVFVFAGLYDAVCQLLLGL